MNFLHIDLETRSTVDIANGVYRYVECPHADALLASYAFDNSPDQMRRWRRGQPCPQDIVEHVKAGGPIKAHNAAFERIMWREVLGPKRGWPVPRTDQFHCIAVTAAAMSLPRSLERLAMALDLSAQKDKRGKALIRLLSIPQGFTEAGNPIWNDDPKLMDEFHDYCDQDVRTEMAADKRLIPLSDAEHAVYVLNEEINDRGIRIDVASAHAALQISEKAKARIDAELCELTGKKVEKVTQTARLAAWVASRGVEMESLDKDTIEEFLHDYDDLPADVRRALELRAEGAKPSVEKIGSMLARVCKDGRARGSYLHHGAGQTGRFSSRGVQLHNMPRYRKEFEDAHLDQAPLFQAIRTGEPSALEWLYGESLGRPLHLLSDAVRGFLWAEPGHELIDYDFSSIEGRFAAWIAGERWKVEAFEAYDRGDGPGMYELTASKIYNVALDGVDKSKRAGGKVAELALGYEGSIGALAKMARQNKIKLPKLYDAIWESATPERREKAEEAYEERLEKHDPRAEKLGRAGWIAAKLIVLGWRGEHPEIGAAWKELNRAARAAVEEPGVKQFALNGKVCYLVRHGFLWCMLPSGRALSYGRPIIKDIDAPWADMTLPPEKREKMSSVLVLGVDAQTEKWVRFPIYGGSLFNNVVQGSCRDILVHAMLNLRRAGHNIVLHTHDEAAIEAPRGSLRMEDVEAVMCDLPPWTRGLPLTAGGWAGKRYRKD